MSGVSDALLAQVLAVGEQVPVPAIHSFERAPTTPGARRNNFAFLRLVDGSIGLTYVALEHTLRDLAAELPRLSLEGRSPLTLAARYAGSSGWERALGLAAINAIGQHLLAGHAPATAMPANLDLLSPRAGERVGMVGYFGRLVEPMRERGIALTVVELDARLVREEAGLEVTLDASRLGGCAQVVITGTTLLNHSLDRLLPCCIDAREIHLLGPSASCLPDVLFEAGVTTVGGFQVTAPDRFTARWASGGRWRDAGRRYALTRDTWPGADALLDAAERRR